MKLTSFTNFLAAAFVVSAAAGVAASCQREAIDPDAQTPGQGEEMVIPVSVEGAISVDGTLSAADTKVTVDPTTGVTAWQTNDLIGVYVSGTGANKFVQGAVSNNAVRLSLASGQTRSAYAIYPYSSASTNAPRVIYPNSYDMEGKDVTVTNTWAPTPMVAVNAPGEDLRFFHVGGLLRLHVTDIPSGATKLEITFTGLSNVFGTFSVNNPGTATATTSYVSGGSNVVTFDNLSIVNNEVYLNIPVPTKDFSGLTDIKVKSTAGSSVITTTKSVYGWGAFGHGTGKKVEVSFVSINHSSGYTGKFRGYEISKGFLVWDTDEYKISDPDDPFLPIRYYGSTGDALAAAKNTVWHQWGGTTDSIKGRLSGGTSTTTDLTEGSVVEGLIWNIPTNDQWINIYGNGTSCTINGTTAGYSLVRVDLSGATSVGAEGYDYSGKGLNDASGGTSSPKGYQVGLLLVPDYTTITCPDITANNKAVNNKNPISWSVLKKFIDGGCVFLPMTGYLASNSWGQGGDHGYYWSSTRRSGSEAYILSMSNGGLYATDQISMSAFLPARVIR